MSSITWLGLDSSISAFGFAALKLEPFGKPAIIAVGTWETWPDKEAARFADTARRMELIARELLELLDRTRPDAAFVESLAYVPGKSSFVTGSILGRVRGVVDGICITKGIPLVEINSMRIKSAVCGSVSAKKHEVAAEMRRIYGVPESLDENATDAVAVAHLGLQHDNVAEWVRRAEGTGGT